MVAAAVEALAAAERIALQTLHALGLAADVHGQPAWPFAHRLAVEALAIDAGLARQVLTALGCAAAALLLLTVGAALARARGPAWTAALALLVAAPWPAPAAWLAEAVPTSFHRSPTGFDAVSIERGLGLYREHCSACHGDDGRGETARAARLPVWPPRLDGPLLGRRADGETFWRIAHGLRDRHGAETMPGAAARLGDAQVWAVIDGLKALAAGSAMRDDAAWTRPVRAPDAFVRCADDGGLRPLSAWRGQRLRVVAAGPGDAPQAEDPRLVTIALRADGGDADRGCAIVDTAAWRAYAQVAGVAPGAFAGTQFIVDRDGWLRALGRPGAPGWSTDDLRCRAGPTTPARPGGRDGLGALIAAIDADPIPVGDGRVHRR